MCRGAAILLLGCVAHAHFPSDSDDHDVDSDSAAGPRRDYMLEPGQFGVDFRLYLKNNTSADPQEVAPGVTVRCWDGKGSEASPDFSAVAPAMTRIDFAAGTQGASWPKPEGGSAAFYLDNDAYFVVMYGNISFEMGPAAAPCAPDGVPAQQQLPQPATGAVVHNGGDMLWAAAGQLIRPLVNAGSGPAAVQVMTPSFAPRWASSAPSCNPSTQAAQVTHRSYLERVGCESSDPEAGWWPNPSPHTAGCIKNGGVQNCMFPAGALADGTADGTPPVLRVKWAPNCSIPYHYHPTGALYFIQYGQMSFKGAKATQAFSHLFSIALQREDKFDQQSFVCLFLTGDYPDRDPQLVAGDVRWVRPGFD